MASNPTPIPEPSGHGHSTGGAVAVATLGQVGGALTGVASLPQAFQQNPYGAAIVAGLAIFAGCCCVAIAWFKYRRS